MSSGSTSGTFSTGLEGEEPSAPTPQQRVFLDLARNFRNIRTPKHQEAICLLTRILANVEKASQIGDGWDIVPELLESA